MKGHLQCNSCLSLLVDARRGTFEIAVADDISNYFENLNRGGLTYSFNSLISIYQAAYSIFSVCISPKYEKSFISLKNQKRVLIELSSEFWQLSEDFDFELICMSCKKKKSACFKMSLSFLFNILLKNYTKSRNDKVKYLTVLNKRMAKF